MPELMLKFDSVDCYYGPHHVLKAVDYEIYPGEIVCLLGGNASAGTTGDHGDHSLPIAATFGGGRSRGSEATGSVRRFGSSLSS